MYWHYVLNKEKKGPVEESIIISAFEQGIIQKTTLVWNETMDDWDKLSNTQLFEECCKDIVPPPLPLTLDTPINSDTIKQHIKKVSVRKFIKYTLLFAFICLVVYRLPGFFAAMQATPDANQVDSSTNLTYGSDSAKAMLVDASLLYSEYMSNPIKADTEFKNKTIRVRGVVSRIDKNFANEAYIQFSSSGSGSVQCNMKDANQVIDIQPGDRIEVIGICLGKKLVIMVLMDECNIINNSQAKSQDILGNNTLTSFSNKTDRDIRVYPGQLDEQACNTFYNYFNQLTLVSNLIDSMQLSHSTANFSENDIKSLLHTNQVLANNTFKITQNVMFKNKVNDVQLALYGFFYLYTSDSSNFDNNQELRQLLSKLEEKFQMQGMTKEEKLNNTYSVLKSLIAGAQVAAAKACSWQH